MLQGEVNGKSKDMLMHQRGCSRTRGKQGTLCCSACG